MRLTLEEIDELFDILEHYITYYIEFVDRERRRYEELVIKQGCQEISFGMFWFYMKYTLGDKINPYEIIETDRNKMCLRIQSPEHFSCYLKGQYLKIKEVLGKEKAKQAIIGILDKKINELKSCT